MMTDTPNEKGPAATGIAPDRGPWKEAPMIIANVTTSATLTATPARHELDIKALRSMPMRGLRDVDDVLTTLIGALMGMRNAGRFGQDGLNEAGTFLEGLEEHLGTLREAVALVAEERLPRSAEEAEERANLVLLTWVRGGATLPDVAELLDRLSREREPILS